MPDAVMGSFCEWTALNDWMFENVPGLDKRNLHGEELMRQTVEFLGEKKPTLMFAYYEIPDDMGHTYGFGTIPYYDGINYAHGGMHDLEKYVYFTASGSGVEHTDLGFMNVRDIAAVVLHALVIELPKFDPKGWTAQIPRSLFSDGSGDGYQTFVVPHRNMHRDLPGNTAPIAFSADNGIGRLFGEDIEILRRYYK